MEKLANIIKFFSKFGIFLEFAIKYLKASPPTRRLQPTDPLQRPVDAFYPEMFLAKNVIATPLIESDILIKTDHIWPECRNHRCT